MARYRKVTGDDAILCVHDGTCTPSSSSTGPGGRVMTTAISGVGRIAGAPARDVRGGERVVPATRQPEQVSAIVAGLSASATAASAAPAAR